MDDIIEHLQHPFYMLIGGMLFWFTFMWSKARNKNKKTKFWSEQKDEIIVTVIGALLFLVFTPLILEAWDWIFNIDTPTEFRSFFYLLVGPAIERLYSLKK